MHICAASTGMLQMLPLILETSPFPCLWEIRSHPHFLKNLLTYQVQDLKANYLRWGFTFMKVFMICFTYAQFFIKWFHCMIQLWGIYLIFFKFKKSDIVLIPALMVYFANLIGALFYLLILNITTFFFSWQFWYLIFVLFLYFLFLDFLGTFFYIFL